MSERLYRDLPQFVAIPFSLNVCCLSAMAPVRSLLSFHHCYRLKDGQRQGQMKEENARKRPKPLPATADNIRCVTLSDFGTNIPFSLVCEALSIAYIYIYMNQSLRVIAYSLNLRLKCPVVSKLCMKL